MFQKDLGVKGYFRIQKFTFQRLGIDLTIKNGQVMQPYFLTFIIFALASIQIPMVVYSRRHLQEIAEVTNAMAPFMQATITLWKIWRVISRRKEMAQLVESIYVVSTRGGFNYFGNLICKATKRELNYLMEENNRQRLMNKAYYCSVLVTGILALTAPVLISFLQYFLHGEFGYIVALKGAYPIDYAQPWNYFLIWLWSAISIYGVIYGSVSVDSIFSWYIHNIVGNFKILQSKLETAEKVPDFEQRRVSLYFCIAYHQRVIAMAEQLNIIYCPIVFVQFSLNALQICFLAYQIGSGVVSTVDFPFLFLFMISVGIQLMIYCYGGQHLQNESENVYKSICKTINSPAWPLELRKVLLISMIRAQKSCKLTGIFFDVDLPLFLWVWRTAGSYVTLLRSVDQQNM